MTNLEYQGILRRYVSSRFWPTSLLRWTPEAADLPDKIGLYATTNLGITSLTLLNQLTLEPIMITGQPSLASISFPLLSSLGGPLVLSGNAALVSLTFPTMVQLPTGTPTGSISIDVSGSSLNQESVDALYNALSLSLSSGHVYYATINTSGGTNATAGAASSLARSSLHLAATGYHITLTA